MSTDEADIPTNGHDLKPMLPLDPANPKPTQEKWDDQKMRNQIGLTVDVERETVRNDAVDRANRALCDIGDYIHANEPKIKELTYCGSAAVHIYLAPTLGEIIYITQTSPLRETEERVAGPAFTQLQKDMMKYYGKKQTRIRSGF